MPQRLRSLPRVPQIVKVLLKYGFGDLVARVGLDSAIHTVKSSVVRGGDPTLHTLRSEERIRRALEDLGPTFVKLGQVMATRPDLLPMSLIDELRLLQDKVPPFDTEGIQEWVEGELGRPLAEVFADFEGKPLAAASIAQVHRATLKDGRKVVLKIQRPNLERIIETDLTILGWLAELIEEQVPELRRYDPTGLVSEFRISLSKEIDFETEAHHMKRFAANFAADPTIHVPAVVEELSTSRILCEEFIEGLPLSDPTLKERTDLDLESIAKNGVRVVIEQALVHGFFHGDPHPGNIFVIPDGQRLCFIDYGMMGQLDQERIDELLVFLVAILTRDLDKLVRLFRRLGLLGEDADVRGLRRDVDGLILRFQSVELARLNLGQFLQGVFDVVTRYQVRIPSDLLLVVKALATVEGVGRELYPELNVLEAIREQVLGIYLRRMADPAYHLRAPKRAVEDALLALETAPRDLQLTLHKLRRGELRVQLGLDELRQVTRAQAQATNRLALSVVIAALAACSTYLLTQADLSPWLGTGFPLHAALGGGLFLLACTLGLLLGVGYLRSGGL